MVYVSLFSLKKISAPLIFPWNGPTFFNLLLSFLPFPFIPLSRINAQIFLESRRYFHTFSNISRDRRRRHSVSLEEKLTSPDVTPIKHKDSSLPPLTFLQSDDQDRRPSLAELQAEDMDRRPSITMYQSVDSQHPDVIAIQKLVERMKFGEIETVESWKLKIFFYSFAASVTKHNFNEKCF